MSLSKNFQSILWEYNLSKLNLDSDIVVERLLNLGDKKLTKFWVEELGKQKAKELFLKNKEKLDKKSANYWDIIFEVKKEKKLNSNRTMYDKLNTPIFTRSFE